MRVWQKLALGVVFALAASSLAAVPHIQAAAPLSYPTPTDAVATPYGSIGKWMIQPNGQISNYGGQPYRGKTLLEAVNVIVVDPNSKSVIESVAKVNWDMSLAGFPARPVHSGGFRGYIDGRLYSQQPGGLINAYSDNSFLVQNDHGRLFGPATATSSGYVYSGAFSTETPTIYNFLPAHAYVSSNAARDAVARRLVATGQVQSVSIDMTNAYNTADTTTGDHDGSAAVIILK